MVELASPVWLLALPVPWLLARWRARWPRQRAASLFHPQAALLGQLARGQKHRRSWWLAGCALLILALARPQWWDPSAQAQVEARQVMVAVDASASMGSRDMALDGQPASRFQVGRKLLNTLLTARPGDRFGVVLFGEDAYTLAPLTRDHSLLEQLLKQIDTGVVGDRTALGNAIALGVQRLQAQPPDQRVLVVLTDGAHTAGAISPQQALEQARKAQVRLYTVGLGPADAKPGRQATGLDEPLLRELAASSGGRYFRADQQEMPARIGRTIAELETEPLAVPRQRPMALFWLPLASGLVLLAVAERHRRIQPC